MILECAIPLVVLSEKNVRDSWQVRAHRVKQQRETVTWHLRAAAAKAKFRVAPDARVVVTLTRVAPVLIRDVDNLLRSLSACRDATAKWMGRDDAESELLLWRYNQHQGKPYAVEVKVECLPG